MFLTFVSCQRDTFEQPIGADNHPYSLTYISLDEAPKQKAAKKMIQELAIKKKEFEELAARGGTIYDSIYNFTIHTDRVALIQRNGDDHWLTFYISRDNPTDFLENLILKWDKGIQGYRPFIGRYNFSSEDYSRLDKGLEIESAEEKFSLHNLEGNGDPEEKIWVSPEGDCFYYSVTYTDEFWILDEVFQIPCPWDLGSGGGGGGGNDNDNGWPPPGYDFDPSDIPDIPDGSGGGGGSGDGGDNPPAEDCHGPDCGPEIATVPISEDDGGEEDGPCDKIAAQIADADFQDKMDTLEDNTDLYYETGYSQNTDGNFTELDLGMTLNDLIIPLTSTLTGVMHAHLDDWEEDCDLDGDMDVLHKPYRMFSPGDVLTFFDMLLNAVNNNIPLSEIYYVMVSSDGDYTLRFSGNIANVHTNFDLKALNKAYKEKFKDYTNNEKAFLYFIKEEIEIDGIRLFEIKNNGTIKEKLLNSNGGVNSNPCE